MAVIIFYFLAFYAAHITCNEILKPHIVVIVGDDIGWNDISLHGSNQIQTPNIDMIGYQGVIFQDYYTDCLGTSSRSALLTGKYAMRMGTQGPSIEVAEDRGIPLTERLLPSYLKDLGYATHLVGKWHLGKSRKCYLPTMRGFDSFTGFTHSSVDYLTFNFVETFNDTEYFGLDFYHDLEPDRRQHGQHLTDVLTNNAVNIIEDHNTSTPLFLLVSHAAAHIGGGQVNLQASYEDLIANSHIAHSARRLFAGLVTGVDNSVGKILAALAKNENMLNNTMMIFMSDNGADSIGSTRNYGSNLPLRGTKGTPWEGAVRSTAVLWHAGINPKMFNGVFHVTDWLPTLIAAAGGNEIGDLDGKNQWNYIVNDEASIKDRDLIITVDDINKWGAYRSADYKIIIGSVPSTCGYYGHDLNKLIYDAPDYKDKLVESETFRVFTEYLEIGLDFDYALEKRDICNLNKRKNKSNDTTAVTDIKNMCVPTPDKGCLFNIREDPEELHDLWEELPDIVQQMSVQFRMLWSGVCPRRRASFDPRADPKMFHYTWYPWLECDAEPPAPITSKPEYPMQMSLAEINYFVSLNLEIFQAKLSNYTNSIATAFVDSVGSLFKQ